MPSGKRLNIWKKADGMSRADFSKLTVIALTLLWILTGCNTGNEEKWVDLNDVRPAETLVRPATFPADDLIFGFDRRLEIKEDVKMYLSFLRYLEGKTGYRFRLHITPKGGSIVDDLGKGIVDFAAIGTGSYLEAREKYGVQMLVRGLNAEGQSEYRSLIITRTDSQVHSLADLKGRSMAFGPPTSTQGHLIPRIMLAEVGIELKDLKAYDHTHSHAETANAVMSGRFDAGGIQDTLGQALAAKGLVRVIAVSRYYPSSGIAVNKDVPQDIKERVRQALLDFDPQGRDKPVLYRWDQTEMPLGFTTVRESDYEELTLWARRFGLLR